MKKKVGIIIAALLCIAVLCVGFYFLKENSISSAEKELTKVEKIITKDLDKDYPATPRETIKLYNQIIMAFHQEKYSAKELEGMCNVAYGLMDIELQGNNPFDEYMVSVQNEVANYNARKREILQANVCDSNEVLYKTDSSNGDDVAFVTASYFVKEDGEYTNTHQMYVLVQDENDNWKIKTYYQIEAPQGDE